MNLCLDSETRIQCISRFDDAIIDSGVCQSLNTCFMNIANDITIRKSWLEDN
jgi:hypothetical protein